MAALSPEQVARSRKTQATILRALASIGQTAVADALGQSEATVSRMKSQDLESFTVLLTVVGLKCVPADHKCYDPKKYEALRTLALEALEREDGPALDWEETP